MTTQTDKIAANKKFGSLITRLINKENLTRKEASQAFITVLNNGTNEMQQGAFLAALAAKGETAMEVAGSWEAIYDLDTTKVRLGPDLDLVENIGTGMDTFKTYNISTAAAIIAAAGNIPMARHGARAITSMCGTVDLAEALGVDEDQFLWVTLDKASVFPMDKLSLVKEHKARLKTQGFESVKIKRLILSKKDL